MWRDVLAMMREEGCVGSELEVQLSNNCLTVPLHLLALSVSAEMPEPSRMHHQDQTLERL